MLYWAGVIRAAQGQLDSAFGLHDTAIEIARTADDTTGIAWNLAARSLIVSAA